MPYDPDKHQRRSIRLRGHDYTTPGAYFVTMCVQGRACVFGTVAGEALALNDSGMMVGAIWEGLPSRFPNITLDTYVVMPNHVHAIIMLGEAPAPGLRLGDIVGAFKSLTTNAYIRGVRERDWPAFERRLWQRNYYEYIIRGEADLARIRTYIATNPLRWEADQLHPAAAPNRFNMADR